MKTPSLRALAATLVLAAVAGCSSTGQADAPPTKGPHDPATMATPAAISGDPYEAAIAQFHQLGLKVWADSDLVGRWLDGPASFHEALARDAHLAGLPGVVGVKVADELGYNDGLDTPQQVQRFLDATAKGLHALAPHTKILVDMVVPDMGCLPWLASRLPQAGQCAQDERNAYPAASMDAVDGYLASGDIDQLDLSTGLRDPDEYASWGISVEQAQREAWTETHRRGWQDETTLQARHAMAHPGDYPGGPATAWSEVNTYVRIPAEEGAADVQVWAWRQEYDGQTVRLMNPGLRTNPLWQALLAARRMGVSMSTTFTPSAMEESLPADAHMIAQVFTGVYVAAGTG